MPSYFWDKWLYFTGKLSWDITTTQVNSALHTSEVTKPSTSFGWGKGGKATAARWQVTLCDPIQHKIFRYSVVTLITNFCIQFTYLLDLHITRYNVLYKSTTTATTVRLQTAISGLLYFIYD